MRIEIALQCENTDFHENAFRRSLFASASAESLCRLQTISRLTTLTSDDARTKQKGAADAAPYLHKRKANSERRPFYHPRVCSRSFSAMAPTARPFIAPVICSLTSASTLASS